MTALNAGCEVAGIDETATAVAPHADGGLRVRTDLPCARSSARKSGIDRCYQALQPSSPPPAWPVGSARCDGRRKAELYEPERYSVNVVAIADSPRSV